MKKTAYISHVTATTVHNHKKAFTLTEIAIVLGIIGLILGAIWAAASTVYGNLKANGAQQGILAAAQAVRSLYATSANTGQVAAGIITSPGMFPTSWQSTTAGVIGNPWHVNPTASFSYVIGKGSQFAVEIDGISDAGCASLVGFYNNQASSAQGGSVPGLVGAAVSIAGATVGGSNTTPQLTVGGAITTTYPAGPAACSGGKLLDNFSVTFDMSIM
jgi:prepilin-type N-terminal cleavage/methylation domain-containing protein